MSEKDELNADLNVLETLLRTKSSEARARAGFEKVQEMDETLDRVVAKLENEPTLNAIIALLAVKSMLSDEPQEVHNAYLRVAGMAITVFRGIVGDVVDAETLEQIDARFFGEKKNSKCDDCPVRDLCKEMNGVDDGQAGD